MHQREVFEPEGVFHEPGAVLVKSSHEQSFSIVHNYKNMASDCRAGIGLVSIQLFGQSSASLNADACKEPSSGLPVSLAMREQRHEACRCV